MLHNLRRVAAGLRGDYLEPEPTPEPEGEDQDQGQTSSALKSGKKTAVAPEEWQDMSEFEREEGMVEVGEVGDRSNFVQEGGEVPELEAAAGEGKKRAQDDDDGKLDKAARKKAKKAKDKEFRAQKEKARAEKSA